MQSALGASQPRESRVNGGDPEGISERVSLFRARLGLHAPGYTRYFDQVAQLQSEANARRSAHSAPFLQSQPVRQFV